MTAARTGCHLASGMIALREQTTAARTLWAKLKWLAQVIWREVKMAPTKAETRRSASRTDRKNAWSSDKNSVLPSA